MLKLIQSKVLQRQSISLKEARYLFEKGSLEELETLATEVKKRFHSKDTASYLIMSILNYTNICVAGCKYCAFYAFPYQKEAYLLSTEDVCKRIEDLLQYDPTVVSFNGGFHPHLKISHYAKLFETIHERFPKLTFFEMTIAEFMFVCKRSKISYEEGARILKTSGTQWITGGGAEVLSESFRKRHSPGKFTVADYFKAQEAVLAEDLGSTATMVIGFDESLDERFEHLQKLRDFQEENQRKIPSFLCWTYKPYNNQLGGGEIEHDEYLRWLAVCRIYLDNIKSIRTSVLTRNDKAFDGLNYGANDFDLPVEDEVTQKAGATISHDFAQLLKLCEARGMKPVKRDPYPIQRTVFLNKKTENFTAAINND